MIRRDRVRLVVGLVLTLAIVVPLGWMWWDSRLPASYSAMDMGELDYGGGPGSASSGEHHGMANMSHGSSVSVADLDTEAKRRADVVVDLTARQGKVQLASGKTVEGYSLNDKSPGPLIEATVGQLVEVRLHNESVKGGVALHWHGVDVPNAQDGVAGVTQDAVGVGEDHTYRWVAPDAGTFWYHSHQLSNEQVVGGLLGGIIVHPEEREQGVRDVMAMAHLYEDVPTIDGHRGLRSVVARPGERVRVRLVNTDNGPQNAWTDSSFLVRAVDGIDVNEPTEVTDRSVSIPAGGRADLEVRVPTDGSRRARADACRCRSLDRSPGQRVAECEAARGGARPARLRLCRRCRLRPGAARPEIRLLRRPSPGLPRRQARTVVERERQALQGHADVRRARGGRRQGPDLQSQQ